MILTYEQKMSTEYRKRALNDIIEIDGFITKADTPDFECKIDNDYRKLEIYDFNVKELVWNEEYSLIKKETKNYSKIIREKKLRRIIGE